MLNKQIFSTQFLRLSGANPIIAVDLNPKRRELALKLGADYAFDPSDKDFPMGTVFDWRNM